MTKSVKTKNEGLQGVRVKASSGSNYSRVIRLHEDSRSPLKTFQLSSWSEKDAKGLQAHNRKGASNLSAFMRPM